MAAIAQQNGEEVVLRAEATDVAHNHPEPLEDISLPNLINRIPLNFASFLESPNIDGPAVDETVSINPLGRGPEKRLRADVRWMYGSS